MRKYTYIIFIIIIVVSVFILSQCTVSTTCGVVTFYNMTGDPISNIKLGGKSISTYMSPGAKTDIWYYENISGYLSAIDMERSEVKYKFRTNYEYQVVMKKQKYDKVFHQIEGKNVLVSYKERNMFFVKQGYGHGDDLVHIQRTPVPPVITIVTPTPSPQSTVNP